jgi:hypothetical protein
MFTTALKAGIPFIGVHTDDPINFKDVLQSIAKKTLMALPTNASYTVGEAYLYYTEDMKAVTVDMYRKLNKSKGVCVVVNPAQASPLIFDAGTLSLPESFLKEYLIEFVEEAKIPFLIHALKGLSLKSATEVAQLTMAATGSLLPHDIRHMRMQLGGMTPGLETLDTYFDFYQMPKLLQTWLELNDKYFLNPNTPQKLMPRGIMLKGKPGVGKSMAASVIAQHWDVPLFRLDIASSMTRWLGESEGRIARNLKLIEENAPCVYLFDEVEKIFKTGGDEGTSSRIQSQFLWWTQYHKSKVLTVMTTNDISVIPPELYRPGRIDEVIEIQELSLSESKLFAVKVYQSILNEMPSMRRQKAIRERIEKLEKGSMSHADVTGLVETMIKEKNWMETDE